MAPKAEPEVSRRCGSGAMTAKEVLPVEVAADHWVYKRFLSKVEEEELPPGRIGQCNVMRAHSGQGREVDKKDTVARKAAVVAPVLVVGAISSFLVLCNPFLLLCTLAEEVVPWFGAVRLLPILRR